MKQLLKKYLTRETILYLVFGGLTTLVNFVVFYFCNRAWGEARAHLSEITAFVAAVIFAYLTNKPFVFQTRDWSARTVLRELPAFFGGRIFSFLVELALVLAARDWLHAGRVSLLGIDGLPLAKVPISVIVVVLNYVFSKLFVFRKKEE